MLEGLINTPWWGYVLATLALTHITIASVTIFLHRHQAHRALDLHPIASHLFRFSVCAMAAAPSAILVELQTFRIVATILGRGVVAPLALVAGQHHH